MLVLEEAGFSKKAATGAGSSALVVNVNSVVDSTSSRGSHGGKRGSHRQNSGNNRTHGSRGGSGGGGKGGRSSGGGGRGGHQQQQPPATFPHPPFWGPGGQQPWSASYYSPWAIPPCPFPSTP